MNSFVFYSLNAGGRNIAWQSSVDFAEGEMVELTPDLKAFFDCWITLDPCQKEAVLQVMKAMKWKKE